MELPSVASLRGDFEQKEAKDAKGEQKQGYKSPLCELRDLLFNAPATVHTPCKFSGHSTIFD